MAGLGRPVMIGLEPLHQARLVPDLYRVAVKDLLRYGCRRRIVRTMNDLGRRGDVVVLGERVYAITGHAGTLRSQAGNHAGHGALTVSEGGFSCFCSR